MPKDKEDNSSDLIPNSEESKEQTKNSSTNTGKTYQEYYEEMLAEQKRILEERNSKKQ